MTKKEDDDTNDEIKLTSNEQCTPHATCTTLMLVIIAASSSLLLFLRAATAVEVSYECCYFYSCAYTDTNADPNDNITIQQEEEDDEYIWGFNNVVVSLFIQLRRCY